MVTKMVGSSYYMLWDKIVINQLKVLKEHNAFTEEKAISREMLESGSSILIQTKCVSVINGTHVYLHPDKVRKESLILWLIVSILATIFSIFISIKIYDQPNRYDPDTLWIVFIFIFGLGILLPYFAIYYPYQRIMRGISRNQSGEWHYNLKIRRK